MSDLTRRTFLTSAALAAAAPHVLGANDALRVGVIGTGGRARHLLKALVKVPNVRKGTLQELARPIVDPSTTIMTDQHASYYGLHEHFTAHFTVDHTREFVRGTVHTNFAESYHSLLKRGIVGAFHHVSEKHLPRYLAEFDRRWNTRKDRDGERTLSVLRSAPGKRLTYKETIN